MRRSVGCVLMCITGIRTITVKISPSCLMRKHGDIDYLPNENLADNLAFSFQMQVLCNEYYPGLTRKIYLKGYRYNMHLKPRYLLVEMGAQTNTYEECYNACIPLARILDMELSGADFGIRP